jgi:aldose sugar dehydrogenase
MTMEIRKRGGRGVLALVLASVLVLMLASGAPAPAWAADNLKTMTVAHGLVHPWSLAFLPDGRMLVTERPGRLRVVAPGGQLSAPVGGVPAVTATGQCGLLEVLPHPQFASNGWVYLSYAEAGEGSEGGNGLAVFRGRLQGNALVEGQVLFRQTPKVSSSLHCAGRMVFGSDGRLYVALGDRFSQKDLVQNLGNHFGKVVRLDADTGKAAADNPFAATTGALPEVFSLGHRNIQGMAWHPVRNELWATEHGPQGGDELNAVLPGRNYGWPLVTYGRNYGVGTRIGEEGPKPGFEQPVQHWVPVSVAPSGMAFLTSDRYPGWKGQLFLGTLRAQALIRLQLQGNQVVAEERLLGKLKERIRDVRQGPDGYLYVLTDNADGRLIRLEP